jgi:hypothetical protein
LLQDHLVRKLSLLVKQYPQGLLMLMLLRMMPSLGKRKATTFSVTAVHAQLRLPNTFVLLYAAKSPRMKFFGLSELEGKAKSTFRRTFRSEALSRRRHGAFIVCAPSSTRRR